MRAVRHRAYGGPEVLRVENVDVPVPAADEVLIRVHAASVNPLDWHLMRGTPYLMRVQSGLAAPRDPRFGVDVAGRVESVGARVTQFAIGDEVFGTVRGSFAEYASGSTRSLARKPASVSFEHAAAAGVAAITALQAVRDNGRVRPGERVLVNGAAGGVGTFAVQIARWLGAEVTAVCSARNIDLVRSLGAARAIDYTRDDFTVGADRFDAIIDTVGGQPLRACRRVLTPRGRYVIVGGPPGRWLAPFDRALRAAVLSRVGSQELGLVMVRASRDDFATLADLLGGGIVKAVVDREYALEDVPAAIGYLEQGHARGKVIVGVRQSGGA
ncbi:MAG TPA: NAD(P)-dependent alcohol dehydrogenase [Vicinamibacterales bacterium]|nr:NAD(P)-dependent alcohol dehydrogenase [Vicinamibacterales bacterium]